MPRPRPLQNLASGRPSASDYQSLTPRTPHSKAGYAEEARGEVEPSQLDANEADYGSYARQQAEPLLASATSASFPRTPSWRRVDSPKTSKFRKTLGRLLRKTPLILGILLAVILFFMILVSWNRPDALVEWLGYSSTQLASAGTPVVDVLDNAKSASIPATAPAPSHTHHTTDSSKFISYENYTTFPLKPTDYLIECAKMNKGYMHHSGGFWDEMHMGLSDVEHPEEPDDGYRLPEHGRTKICKSTITYMLDGRVGLLADLALMAQVAALARERNRTFFIDDTYWNRGKWSDHFQDVHGRQPGPQFDCLPPPHEELVACPRHARHWVVNSLTAKFHLGHAFSNTYEDPYARDLNRLKLIYQQGLDSFAITIRPNAQNAALIRSMRTEVTGVLAGLPSTKADTASAHPAPGHRSYVGVHIRRGDRHGSSWKYHNKHLPTSLYVDAILPLWDRLFALPLASAHTESASPPKPEALAVYVASDSPGAQDELATLVGSGSGSAGKRGARIFSLKSSADPQLRALASPAEYVQREFVKQDEAERIAQTRGMIVDFAMLSGMWAWKDDIRPEAVVCGISSNVCRVAAMGYGWGKAFGLEGGDTPEGVMDDKKKRWVEIDNNGAITPLWEAFELF